MHLALYQLNYPDSKEHRVVEASRHAHLDTPSIANCAVIQGIFSVSLLVLLIHPVNVQTLRVHWIESSKPTSFALNVAGKEFGWGGDRPLPLPIFTAKFGLTLTQR